MPGAYCRYCTRRCFVYRILPDRSWSGHMATCPDGMAHDREATGGYDHTTTINPMAARGRVDAANNVSLAWAIEQVVEEHRRGEAVDEGWLLDIAAALRSPTGTRQEVREAHPPVTPTSAERRCYVCGRPAIPHGAVGQWRHVQLAVDADHIARVIGVAAARSEHEAVGEVRT